ncbi:unnamed protein product [Brachionus calyciflorus]|uniref:L-type lectin-like domain-containing protein n=1 Tax=Brachionus calyciflorus TaxID=104777 RepID=A0A814ATZ2_9BILA|nr:unnamed protein product [Brachionus calyciflorus]
MKINALNLFCLVVIFLCLNRLSTQQTADLNDLLRREHSLIKPYGGSSAGIPFWDFVGSTIVSNKFVRLTADSQSLQGALWNTIPVDFTDWEIQFQFHVHGHGKDLFGDGFAMWYTKERNVLGPVFGNKDHFTGLGIILDTYANYNGPNNRVHPYISAMINNGSLGYDHEKDGINTALAGCESMFRNKDYDTFLAVRYQNYKLTVSTDVDNKNQWKECLSVENVKLPTRYYFGFSAATGDLSDNHDIISVKVYRLESPRKNEQIDHSLIEPSSASFPEQKELVDAERPSTAWRVIKIMFISVFVIGLVVGALYVGYNIYDKQRRTKKRFY